MRLSEIAEHIIQHDPDFNMTVNKEVMIGCREQWYEESLIEPLKDYYMFEVMGLCGCGNLEDTYEVIRRYLHIRQDYYDNKIEYVDVVNRYKDDLYISQNNNISYGLLQFMMYILDSYGFIEHGSSIGGNWLTEDGERLLTVLDAWHDANAKK